MKATPDALAELRQARQRADEVWTVVSRLDVHAVGGGFRVWPIVAAHHRARLALASAGDALDGRNYSRAHALVTRSLDDLASIAERAAAALTAQRAAVRPADAGGSDGRSDAARPSEIRSGPAAGTPAPRGCAPSAAPTPWTPRFVRVPGLCVRSLDVLPTTIPTKDLGGPVNV